MILRDYQEKAISDFKIFLSSKEQKGLLINPVGTGKSIYPALFSDITNVKTLCIQPSVELLEQNVEKAKYFGLNPTIYSSSISKNISSLTYATLQSLYNKENEFKKFDLVIVDEAHQKMTNTLIRGKVSNEGKINEFLKAINPKKIIGMTATPIQLVPPAFFGESSTLKMINLSKRSFWHNAEIFHITQISEIANKFWSNIEYRQTSVNSSMLILNSTGSEFTDNSIREAYLQNNTTNRILDKYDKLITEGKKSILIFVPSVEEGKILAAKRKNFNFIHAETNKKERKELIEKFKNFEIDVLINCNTLTTGFDHPGLDVVIIGRETNSFSLYYQIIGRLVRPLIINGQIIKTQSIVEDLTSNFERFGKIENIIFEKDRFNTKGWAMWNGDNLLTTTTFVKSNKQLYVKQPEQSINNLQKQPEQIIEKRKIIKFTFGKHSSKSVFEVYNTDKNYLKWLSTTDNFNWKGKEGIKLEIERLLNK